MLAQAKEALNALMANKAQQSDLFEKLKATSVQVEEVKHKEEVRLGTTKQVAAEA
jgi:hypothetical protein